MEIVNLVRERKWEEQIRVDSFEVIAPIESAEHALRNAVAEYLTTDGGKKAIDDTCEDFNWGDSVNYVPDEIWEKHGLRPHPRITNVMVDQDEVLCSDEKESEDYQGDGMEKISYEEALSRFRSNREVFLLYSDNTEAVAENEEEIQKHHLSGDRFGYEK